MWVFVCFSAYNSVMGSIIALVIYILTRFTNCNLLAGALDHISTLSKCFIFKSREATCLCFYHQGRTTTEIHLLRSRCYLSSTWTM